MRIYHWLVALYTLVSILALLAIPLSAAGWIDPDPLSAIPAMLLGVPWSFLLTSFVDAESPALNFLLLLVAVAINAGLIWMLGRFISRR